MPDAEFVCDIRVEELEFSDTPLELKYRNTTAAVVAIARNARMATTVMMITSVFLSLFVSDGLDCLSAAVSAPDSEAFPFTAFLASALASVLVATTVSAEVSNVIWVAIWVMSPAPILSLVDASIGDMADMPT